MTNFSKTERIKSLDELAQQEFIWCNGRIYHCGWFISWPINLALSYIQDYKIYKVIKNEH